MGRVASRDDATICEGAEGKGSCTLRPVLNPDGLIGPDQVVVVRGGGDAGLADLAGGHCSGVWEVTGALDGVMVPLGILGLDQGKVVDGCL